MVLTIIFAALAGLSLILVIWQAVVAWRFPVHRRDPNPGHAPAVVLLKPLKGCYQNTRSCLASWMTQQYAGKVTILFGVAEAGDPVNDLVRELIREFPHCAAELVLTPESLGPNAKISNVAQLYRHYATWAGRIADEVLCLSDADVRVPPDFIAQAVQPLRDPKIGLVTSLYQFANPVTFAMDMEAVAVNADFWSQVLQSNMLKPQDFALGAAMIFRRAQLASVGGFADLAQYMADDYQLGNRIAKAGLRVELLPIVAECWDAPMTFREVWAHQLRWARTIRVSQPLPYFFSILNNVTLWATVFAASAAAQGVYRVAKGYPWHMDALWIVLCLMVWGTCVLGRFSAAQFLVKKLTKRALPWTALGVVIAKDLMQVGIWATAFTGNTVGWRGRRFKIRAGGRLEEIKSEIRSAKSERNPKPEARIGSRLQPIEKDLDVIRAIPASSRLPFGRQKKIVKQKSSS